MKLACYRIGKKSFVVVATLAWLRDPEAEKVLRNKPRSLSNNFQGKKTMEMKYLVFKARNNYMKKLQNVGCRTFGKILSGTRNCIQ